MTDAMISATASRHVEDADKPVHLLGRERSAAFRQMSGLLHEFSVTPREAAIYVPQRLELVSDECMIAAVDRAGQGRWQALLGTGIERCPHQCQGQRLARGFINLATLLEQKLALVEQSGQPIRSEHASRMIEHAIAIPHADRQEPRFARKHHQQPQRRRRSLENSRLAGEVLATRLLNRRRFHIYPQMPRWPFIKQTHARRWTTFKDPRIKKVPT